MSLRLYTKDNCKYCGYIAKKLKEWNVTFTLLNVSHNDIAREYLKKNGYNTVPQLFLDDFKLNPDNTKDFTEDYLYEKLDKFIEETPQTDIDKIVKHW